MPKNPPAEHATTRLLSARKANDKDLPHLLELLEEIKAEEVSVIHVAEQTSVTDDMVICTGRSSRHVRSIAEFAVEKMKASGIQPLSQNGLESGEWALVDFGDFVLHVMQPQIRQLYNLEELWS